MDYKKHYELLIERAKNRTFEGYTEKHHIIPRCMGGTDDDTNLVDLTPEEHYVAHQLLCKMYPKNGALGKAVLMMTVNRTNNKIYGWVRKRHSGAMKESQSGEKNSQHGTKWIYNLELKESKKIQKTENVPNGWKLGRIVNFDNFNKKIKEREQQKVKRQVEQKEKERQEIIKIKPLYERYKNGEPLQQVAEDFEYSYVCLYKKFLKYFEFVEKQTGRGNKRD